MPTKRVRRRRNSKTTDQTLQEPPVCPGESSGCFKPLTDKAIKQVHNAALDVLEKIGLSQAIPSCIERVTHAGGTYSNDDRLFFPRALIESTLATAARNITLYGQTPDFDLNLAGSRTYFGTAGAAVHIVDSWKAGAEGNAGAYRDSTLKDVYDAARLVDRLEHIHYFQRCLVARDVEDPRLMDLNTCYASVAGTRKHVGTSFVESDHVTEALDMLHRIAGSEEKWRERPFVSASTCFVVPPLRFAEDACHVLQTCVEGGMPVLLLSAGQAGATSPVALSGSVVQGVAEVLAGLVFVNLIKPGHPAIFGAWPFVSDLRTGSMTGGSGEQAVLMAAVGQMGRYYKLPTGIAAGMTDSKIPDAQSGYEKAYSLTMAGHSGANLVYESAGMHASLMGFSFESCVIDNDMLGAINRSIRGIDMDSLSLSLEAMREVCLEGPEHYLGHSQTLERMKKEFIYPDLANRQSPTEWQEQGSPSINVSAREKAQKILATHYPRPVSQMIDHQIRNEFDIRLPQAQMQAADN